MLFRSLRTVVREPVAVYAPVAAGGSMTVRISLKQRYPGEARSAIYAVMGSCNLKNIFVVDPDIDIYSDEQIDWALATRFQPDRDLVVLQGMRTLPLDPSLGSARTGGKAGFDLTWPFGSQDRLDIKVPEAPHFNSPRFASVEAALQHGPCYFEDLMEIGRAHV